MATPYRARRFLLSLFTALAVIGFAAISQLQGADEPPAKTIDAPQVAGSVAPAVGTAADALGSLPVKGRAPKTGYTRSQFGSGWKSVQGCDMRNRILQRDLTDITFVQNNSCLVASGTLHDPYTGNTITFQRGNTTSSLVQIDHVVALSNAWQTGAQQLDAALREQLANDPLELIAVDGSANQQKGDGDAATWLPANKPFRCQYAARQIAVKQKYSLWVTAAEKSAMERILSTCPGQVLPTP